MRQTSVEAYNQIRDEGLLSKLQFEVYDAIYQNGPLTQGELWKRCFPSTQRHNIAPRCAELQEMGVYEVIATQPDLTAFMPKRPVRTTEQSPALPPSAKS